MELVIAPIFRFRAKSAVVVVLVGLKVLSRNSTTAITSKQKNNILRALVLCQSLIEGYSFLSLIRASSVVNRQWTVVPC